MILDTAATKAVVGRPWIEDYYENSSKETRKGMRISDDNRNFRF